jgi:hypothetical protein
VPTIGLPLLMEFKCFPGRDRARVERARRVARDPLVAALPAFRAYSTGGTNSSGQTVTIDPDLATIAQGGFNPGSTPPGAPTQPIDDVFTLGQMDLVVRVSRVHSVWIDLGVPNASFVPPVLEPPAQAQPPGTQIVPRVPRGDGDHPARARGRVQPRRVRDSDVPGAVAFLGGDSSWKSSTAELTGARFVQVRATFVSNAATGLTPLLTAMGLASFGP